MLICHVAEQAEWVNLSRLLQHFLMIAKLQAGVLPPIHTKVKLEKPFLWWPTPQACHTGFRDTISRHKQWFWQLEESKLERKNLCAWKANEKFTQRQVSLTNPSVLLNFTIKHIFLWKETDSIVSWWLWTAESTAAPPNTMPFPIRWTGQL